MVVKGFEISANFKFKFDERVKHCDSLKEGMEKGFVRLDNVDVLLVNDEGNKCLDEDLINLIIEAMMYGLKEKA